MPSVLLLFVDQNEGFVKIEVRKNRVVVDAILQLTCEKGVFEDVKFSYPLIQETCT